MKIIIPSKGRPDNIITKTLKKQNIPKDTFYMVIRDTELPMYMPFIQESNITALVIEDTPDLDDAITRNKGLELIMRKYPHEQFVGFIDDDIKRIKNSTILQGFDQLLTDLELAQQYVPDTWIISAKQDAAFTEPHAININKHTVWVGCCLIQVSKMPDELFRSTKIDGPQEVTIPLFTLANHKSFASTSNVLFYAGDSMVGGLSDVYQTESRELREQAFQHTTYAKYITVIHSRTAKAYLSRCNMVALRKDFPCVTLTLYTCPFKI